MKKVFLTLSIYLSLFVSLTLLHSCKEEGYATINIKGITTDTDGQFIDSLLITIQNKQTKAVDAFRVSYTHQNFDRVYTLEKAGSCDFIITVEDIDGERNGGYFKEQTKTISVSESEYTTRNDLMVIHPYASKEVNFVLEKLY